MTATPGDGQTTIAFNPPASNGGSAITSYTVTSSPGGKTAGGSASPITVIGLSNGTTYTFTVAATNAVGGGPASAASGPVTPTAAATVPGPPVSVTAAARRYPSDRQLLTSGRQRRLADQLVHGHGCPGREDRKRPGKPDHRQRAHERHELHLHRHRRQRGRHRHAVRRVQPGYTDGSAGRADSARTTERLGRSGRRPGDGQLQSARVERRLAGHVLHRHASLGGKTASGAASPITISGLTNGTSYTFTVTAGNAVGTGAASSTSSAVTPSAPTTPVTPPSPGGGGGGGGGGAVNLKLTLGATPTPHTIGDSFAYVATIVNNGGSADDTMLTVNLPAAVTVGATKVDRGPGCTTAGQTVTCPLCSSPPV